MEDRPKQLVQYNPEETLMFSKQDVTSNPKSVLELRNTSGENVVYKIRTTNPKKFFVEPSHGLLRPEGEVRITISNQKPGHDEAMKDRFQVITLQVPAGVEVPSDESQLTNDFYKSVWGDQAKHPDQITHKLRTQTEVDQGLSSAEPSGLRSSILESVQDEIYKSVIKSPEKARRNTVAASPQQFGQDKHLQQEYNDLASRYSSESDRIQELRNQIKKKKDNLDLMRSANIAAGHGPITQEKPGSPYMLYLVIFAASFVLTYLMLR
jgi:hypothetical protein